jgi:hypothetical protein
MAPPARSLLIVLSVWTALNLVGTVLLWRERAAHAASGSEHAAREADHDAPQAADSADPDARPAAAGHSAHAAGPDTRRGLVLPAAARDAVLAEMRTMLISIQAAAAAAARGDTAAMRTAAQPSGMAMAADHALEDLLPPDWLALALTTHRAFDSLPLRAATPTQSLAALGELTAGCTGCHAIYRLEPAPPPSPTH